jgi:hypothetical protein
MKTAICDMPGLVHCVGYVGLRAAYELNVIFAHAKISAAILQRLNLILKIRPCFT